MVKRLNSVNDLASNASRPSGGNRTEIFTDEPGYRVHWENNREIAMGKFELGHEDGWSRRFFESFTTFYDRPDLIKLVIAAYDKAGAAAALSARFYVAHGGESRKLTAVWDEAVAQSFERVLACLAGNYDQEPIHEGEDINLPVRPDFEM